MPPPRIPIPPKAELLKIARECTSLSKVADRIGMSANSFRARLRADGVTEEIKAALKTVELEPKAIDDPDRVALQRSKEENRVLRKENRDYAEKLASQEEFFERIVDATRVEVDRPKLGKPKKQAKAKPPNSVITPVYDQQYGQFVQPSDTPGGRGSFSEAIFDERLARWVKGVCGIIASRADTYKLEELIIPLGGDQVEGDEIFAGQAWQLEMGPPRQVWELSLKMAAALTEVVRFAKTEIGIPYIAMYGIPGNHGKVGGRKSGARPSDYSWDWLHHMILFDRLRAEPIDQLAIEPAGSLFFYCAGHEFQAIHGDEIRGWGGIPFYGLTRHDGRSMRLHNRLYRYLIMGHIHQPAEIPNGAGETLVQGDWVGPNNLSGQMTAGSRPQQRVTFVSKRWGVDGSERIYFAEADTAYQPTPIHGQKAA